MNYRPLHLAIVVATAVVIACASRTTPASNGPAQSPRASLQSTTSSRRPAVSGPLKVVFHAPDGPVSRGAGVSVMFDRPMIALDRADRLTAPPLEITPHVEGTTRWIGSRVASFEPKGPWPKATRFTARVAAGLRALDGETLSATFEFAFETAGLRVRTTSPRARESWVLAERKLDVCFDQRVDPAKVASHLALSAEGPLALRSTVTLEKDGKPEPSCVRITPARPLPKGTEVTLEVQAGLVGEEGALPLNEPARFTFSTVGDFKVLATEGSFSSYNSRSPDNGFSLVFSNGVKRSAALRAVHITPPVTHPSRISDDLESDDETTYIYLGSGMAPLTTYAITVDAGLRDRYGNALIGPRTFSYTTTAYAPRASLAVDGHVMETSAPARLRAYLSNISGASLQYLVVDRDRAILGMRNATLNSADPPPIGLPLPTRGPKQRGNATVDLAAITGPALFLARTRAPGMDSPYMRLLQRTNLGLLVKRADGELLAWVAQLTDGRPVVGADVALYKSGSTTIVAHAATDAQGLVRFTHPDIDEDYVVAAQSGNDIALESLQSATSPWDLGHHPGDASSVRGVFFTERGIYRPGETVHTKVVFGRWSDTALTPVSGEVKIVAKDSSASVLLETKGTLSALGTFSVDIPVPVSASLGALSICASVSGGVTCVQPEVAEYVPVESEANAAAATPYIVGEDTARFTVTGRYLFGGAMSRANVRWSIASVQTDVRPVQSAAFDLEPYTFASSSYAYDDIQTPDDEVTGSGTARTNEQGVATITWPAPRVREPRAQASSLHFEATVHGTGNEAPSAFASMTRLNAEYLVGLDALEKGWLTAKERFSPHAVAVTLDGRAVQGRTIEFELTRHSWKYERSANDAGQENYAYKHHAALAGRCVGRTGTAASDYASCELSAPKAGLYTLTARSLDSARRQAFATETLWVAAAAGETDRTTSWPVSERGITLTADKSSYRTGEVARILVASPFDEAEALITVERAGISSVVRTHLVGKAPIVEVPIDARFIPNAYVSVSLVRGRVAGRTGDDGRPAHVMGTLMISATDTIERRLKIEVAADAPTKRPGDQITATVRMRDVHGRPVSGELAFYAVDEGVLALTGYKAPELFDTFYAPHGLSIYTTDSRRGLMTPIEVLPEDEKGGDEGGDGGAGLGLRSRFEAVAHFAPRVMVGDSGDAAVRFQLPDNLTTYRLMAVAVGTGSRYGTGTTRVVVNKPLLMRPLLPRFARVDDVFDAGVVVHSFGAGTGRVRVTADVRGVEIMGPREKTIDVEEGQGKEVTFRIRASALGTARFTFSAVLGDARDALSIEKPIQIYSKVETVSAAGDTTGEVQEALLPLTGVRSDVGGVEVTLSGSALAGLAPALDSLADYQWECTEQLASRLLPRASLAKLDGAFPELRSETSRKEAQYLVTKIETRLDADGSFRLWDNWGYPDINWRSYLTAYALMALHTAEDAGFAVNDEILTRARTFLLTRLSVQSSYNQGIAPGTLAFLAEVLAETGGAPAALLDSVWGQRQALSHSERAMFAHALLLTDRDSPRAATLLREVANQVKFTAETAHIEASSWYSNTDVAATAQYLRAVVATGEQTDLAPRIARYLTKERGSNGGWYTTNDTAWALLALLDYARAYERPASSVEAQVAFNSSVLASHTFAPGTLETAKAQLPITSLVGAATPLVFRQMNDDGGRLYYSVRLRYARSELPTSPIDRGYYVERSYEAIDPLTLRPRVDDTKIYAGDLVRVKLAIVASETMSQVVLDDALPAGFAAVDFNLATTSQAWQSVEQTDCVQDCADHDSDADDYDDRYDSDAYPDTYDYDNEYAGQLFAHRELRDNRVVLVASSMAQGIYSYSYLARANIAGHYRVPPTHIEAMYDPDLFGRTAGLELDVYPAPAAGAQ